jgi:cytidylate kinase
MVLSVSIITISRQDGSLGSEIAIRLSHRLNMQLIERDKVISDWMSAIVNDYQLHMLSESPKFFLNLDNQGISFKQHAENLIKEAAEKTPSIILGMGGQIIFAENKDAFKIRITASEKVRIERIKKKYGFGEKEAEMFMQKGDRRHKRYISLLYSADWADPLMYDLTINTDNLSCGQCAEIIALYTETKKSLKFTSNKFEDKILKKKKESSEIIFKHPAEEEFANILDMYNLDWEYEPNTFPVEWDAEGNVTMAFSPDFYLTKFDTYIEITTMEQKYVTTKNKKVRKLRELYPGININIVYKKDFHSLLKRFGFSGGAEIDEFNRGS